MSLLDDLLRGVKFVLNASGVQMPQESAIQFTGNVTVSDLPGIATVVNVGSGSGASGVQAPNVWTYGQGAVFTYPQGANTWEAFDTSGGAITALLDPSAINGEVNGLKDIGRSLSASHLKVQASSTVQIEYPPGTFNNGASGVIFGGESSGIDVGWRWYGSRSIWYVED